MNDPFARFDPDWQLDYCLPGDALADVDIVEAYGRFVRKTEVYDPATGEFWPAELRCNATFENAAILVREAA